MAKAAIIGISRTLVARAARAVAPLHSFQQVAAVSPVHNLLVAGLAVARRRAAPSSTRRRVIVRVSTQAPGTIAPEYPTFKHGAGVRVRTLGDNFIARLTPEASRRAKVARRRRARGGRICRAITPGTVAAVFLFVDFAGPAAVRSVCPVVAGKSVARRGTF